jgi:hypothetical protein
MSVRSDFTREYGSWVTEEGHGPRMFSVWMDVLTLNAIIIIIIIIIMLCTISPADSRIWGEPLLMLRL